MSVTFGKSPGGREQDLQRSRGQWGRAGPVTPDMGLVLEEKRCAKPGALLKHSD